MHFTICSHYMEKETISWFYTWPANVKQLSCLSKKYKIKYVNLLKKNQHLRNATAAQNGYHVFVGVQSVLNLW